MPHGVAPQLLRRRSLQRKALVISGLGGLVGLRALAPASRFSAHGVLRERGVARESSVDTCLFLALFLRHIRGQPACSPTCNTHAHEPHRARHRQHRTRTHYALVQVILRIGLGRRALDSWEGSEGEATGSTTATPMSCAAILSASSSMRRPSSEQFACRYPGSLPARRS